MSVDEFEALAPALAVREVRLSIPVPGFRPTQMIVVTTLTDPKRYPKSKLADLYHLRWQAAEVNLKHLKTTLGMDIIHAKTPAMVTKSIWVHRLTYNLLRTLMWQASTETDTGALRISLQGTRQQFNHFRPILAHSTRQERRRYYYA